MDQLQKLRDFKKKTFPKALIETYTSQIEFRDKLAKQLEIQLRVLLAQESRGDNEELKSKPITDIQFEFADSKTGARLGSEWALETTALQIESTDEIPDYKDPTKDKVRKVDSDSLYLLGDETNKDYYPNLLCAPEFFSSGSLLVEEHRRGWRARFVRRYRDHIRC